MRTLPGILLLLPVFSGCLADSGDAEPRPTVVTEPIKDGATLDDCDSRCDLRSEPVCHGNRCKPGYAEEFSFSGVYACSAGISGVDCTGIDPNDESRLGHELNWAWTKGVLRVGREASLLDAVRGQEMCVTVHEPDDASGMFCGTLDDAHTFFVAEPGELRGYEPLVLEIHSPPRQVALHDDWRVEMRLEYWGGPEEEKEG